jgi:hypothetical protein
MYVYCSPSSLSQPHHTHIPLCLTHSSCPQPDSQFIRELAEISLQQSVAATRGGGRPRPSMTPAEEEDDDILEALTRLELKESDDTDDSSAVVTAALPSSSKSDDDKDSFLSSKEWKKGFLSSKKASAKKLQTNTSPSQQITMSSGSDTRTTRGILKNSGQPKPLTPNPSSSPSPLQSAKAPLVPVHEPVVTSSTLPQETVAEPPPAPPKRVSKFMAERMGGVNMIADMNQRPAPATKSFTGKIMERG